MEENQPKRTRIGLDKKAEDRHAIHNSPPPFRTGKLPPNHKHTLEFLTYSKSWDTASKKYESRQTFDSNFPNDEQENEPTVSIF